MNYVEIQAFFKAQDAAGLKRCSVCGQWKPKSEYSKKLRGLNSSCKVCDAYTSSEWRKHNRERHRASVKAWQKANPIKNKSYRHKTAYGITLEEKEEMLRQQGGVCALCGTDNPKHKNGWQTEHDHDTDVVRGIVCWRCNQGIEWYKKLTTSLEEYLKRGQLKE